MVTVSLYHCHPVNAKQLPFLICFSNLFQPLLICFNFHLSSMLQLFVTQIVFNLRGCHKIQKKTIQNCPTFESPKVYRWRKMSMSHVGKLSLWGRNDFSRRNGFSRGGCWKRRPFSRSFFPENFWVHPTHQPTWQRFSAAALARRRSFTSQSLVTWLCIKRHLEGAEVGPMGDGKNWKSCFKLDNDIKIDRKLIDMLRI